MENMIDLLIKEASRYAYRESDIMEYSKKRNIINYLAAKSGYKEKRDGRIIGIKGIPYCNMGDKVNYCLKYSNNGNKERIKKAFENFKPLTDRILGGNIKLVIKEALKYGRNNVNLGDFLQEGSAGLLYALSKFRPSLGQKFSTYATYWIKHYMRNSLESQPERTIRIPKQISDYISKVKRRLHRMKIQKEIADLSPDEIKHLIKVSDSLSNTVWHSIKLQKTISLDHNLSEDLKIEDILGECDKEQKEIWISDALKTLDNEDREIIEMRYLKKL